MKSFGNPPKNAQIFTARGTSEISVNGIAGPLLMKELDLLYSFGEALPDNGILVNVCSEKALTICSIVSGIVNSSVSNPEIHVLGYFEPMVIKDIDRAGMKDIIHAKYGDPILLAEMFEDQSIDSIYIDSNKTFEGFYEELNVWYPKKKETGIIRGHDGCGEVRRALRKFCEKINRNFFIIEPPKANYLWTIE